MDTLLWFALMDAQIELSAAVSTDTRVSSRPASTADSSDISPSAQTVLLDWRLMLFYTVLGIAALALL